MPGSLCVALAPRHALAGSRTPRCATRLSCAALRPVVPPRYRCVRSPVTHPQTRPPLGGGILTTTTYRCHCRYVIHMLDCGPPARRETPSWRCEGDRDDGLSGGGGGIRTLDALYVRLLRPLPSTARQPLPKSNSDLSSVVSGLVAGSDGVSYSTPLSPSSKHSRRVLEHRTDYPPKVTGTRPTPEPPEYVNPYYTEDIIGCQKRLRRSRRLSSPTFALSARQGIRKMRPRDRERSSRTIEPLKPSPLFGNLALGRPRGVSRW